MIRQGMQDHGGVLARFDDLVEIADGALTHRTGQGAINPARLSALEEEAAHQIGRGEIVMTGHGDELALQIVRHGLSFQGLPVVLVLLPARAIKGMVLLSPRQSIPAIAH